MRSRTWLRRNAVTMAISGAVWMVLVTVFLVEDVLVEDVLVEALPPFATLHRLEHVLSDLRIRHRDPRQVPDQVVIVAIDNVNAFGRWPWSRARMAELQDRLREAEADTVAFDLTFNEPEEEAAIDELRRISEILGDNHAPTRRALDQALARPAGDEAFRLSMERSLELGIAWPVLAYRFLYSPSEVRLSQERGLPEEHFSSFVDLLIGPSTYDLDSSLLRRNPPPRLAIGIEPVVPDLAAAAYRLGFVDALPDHDAALRREMITTVYPFAPGNSDLGQTPAELLRRDETRVYAYMPLSVAAVASFRDAQAMPLDFGLGKVEAELSEGTRPVLAAFEPFVPTIPIDYYGLRPFPRYSFADVISDRITDNNHNPITLKSAFKGKLVFVGVTDSTASDYFPSAFGPLPGVEKQATVAANLLDNLERGTEPVGDYELATLLTSLGVAVTVAVVAANFGPLLASVLLLGIAVGLGFLSAGGGWNQTVPGLTLIIAHALVTTYRRLYESRIRQQVRSAFSTYVSEVVVSEILDNPGELKLGGERRVCTMFFSDLVDFTTISEKVADPERLVTLMNRYLGRMTDVILARDGYLDKYIGDAIMALFGAPVSRPGHAADACAAALDQRQALRELRSKIGIAGLPALDCRIGISTGEVLIGNIGSRQHMSYTVLGDAVNLASRLEGANREYGTKILVAETSRTQALAHDPELVFRPLDLIAMKGKTRPESVFTLVGRRSHLEAWTHEIIEIYSEGLDLYRRGSFTEARQRFENALRIEPTDGPSKTLLRRCQLYEKSPPKDFNGVFRMSSK